MAIDGKFSSDTILTLSKRAALLCSNPDCGVLTSGPTADASGSLNIGEAAHIYGRRSGAARYKYDLTATELADITNGIWLCRNCHKLIDNDPIRHPPDLLFHWRRRHESAVMERVGKPGEQLREKIQAEHLRPFKNTSALAQQIVLDRPPYWEYKLTVELLRTGLEAIEERWRHLRLGMYFRKSTTINDRELGSWLSASFNDLSKIVGSLLPLLEEMQIAWGPPGTPGDEKKILTTCNLIIAAAENMLAWEEELRFSNVAEEFNDVLASMQGVGGSQIDELLRIPKEISNIFAVDNPAGVHEINIVLRLPDDFVDKFGDAINRATRDYLNRD